MGELLVYKASAGSGKTFMLAVEYIKLLIADPFAYREILAVTFTNKATAEMKERILSQLYGIYVGASSSDSYLNRIQQECGMAVPEIRQAAGRALNYILHDYSNFRVETIDSFFQSVMRNLARELDMSPNINIELNNVDVLNEAVDSLIAQLTLSSPTLGWILKYIEERMADDKHWNVSNEIKKFARNLFDENFVEKGERLGQQLQTKGLVGSYQKQLKALEAAVLKQMQGVARRFGQVLQAHALSPQELIKGDKGIASYFRKLGEGNIADSIVNDTVNKCLQDASNWCSKTAPRRSEIVALAGTELMPLLQEAEKVRHANSILLNSCRLSLRHLNNLQLLINIDDEVRRLNRDNNRFLLSDTTTLLHQLVKGHDSSFIFEKIGANLRHVMIDEFQDTSRVQWEIFKLLLIESLSQGADSLIVGDVKQSIYRWRNGDWRILNNLERQLDRFKVCVRSLTVNYRSESNIIRFNNQVFASIVAQLCDAYSRQLGLDCEELQKAYRDVAQQPSKEVARGYAKAVFLSPGKDEDYVEKTLDCLGQEVERLLAQGVRLNDIAILVRKNKYIPYIADYFERERHCKIVSDEAFRLDASAAVCMLVDALRYLSDGENRIACAQLCAAYAEKVLGRTGSEANDLLLGSPEELLPAAFAAQRDELLQLPVYDLLERLVAIFGIERIPRQEGYLYAFFDEVMKFLQDHPSDINGFLAYWDEKLCGTTIPAGEAEGIRVYSIHKSKGLEFHTVLLPFCDWKMENETNDQLVWCAPQQPPFDTLSLLPVNYCNNMAESVYKADYVQEKLQLWVDNLNLLYVALTRAEKNLVVWCRGGQSGVISELLGGAVASVAAEAGGGVYELGELVPSEEEAAGDRSGNRLLCRPEKMAVPYVQFPQHAVQFRQSNRSADFISRGDEGEPGGTGFIERGKVLHALFSGIRTLADVDATLDKLEFEGVFDAGEREELKRAIEAAFAIPQVQSWYSGTWEVFNECSIVFPSEEGMETRRPDRVMVKEGKALVVDFKFGKEESRYRKQVEEYMQLLEGMGYRDVEGYLWYVGLGKIVDVRDVRGV